MKREIKLSGIKQQHHNNSELDAYKEEFDRKGFVIVKNVFDPEQIAVQGNQILSGVEDISYATSRSFGIKIGYKF